MWHPCRQSFTIAEKLTTTVDICSGMKTCIVCQVSKDETEFGPDASCKDGLRGTCHPCKNKSYKAWYFEKGGKERRQVCIKRNYDYICQILKQSKCVDCGDTRWEVLEFDHVRGEKVDCVTYIAHRGQSIKKVQAEIEKCEVRCANCHRLKTYRDRGARGLSWAPLDP